MERTVWELYVFSVLHLRCCKQYSLVVFKGDRSFLSRVSSYALRSAALAIGNVDVEASHTVGCESDVLSVGAPYRITVEPSVRSNLCSLSSVCRNSK